MKAVYGKVTNVKAFQSTGSCRIEVEVPVEAYRDVVALLWDQRVLVTLAPELGRAYGVVEPREGEEHPSPAPFIPPRPDIGPLCLLAVKLCREPDFQAWLQHEFPHLADEWEPCPPEQWAKNVILDVCEISSRRDLDESVMAAQAFHDIIRKPFHDFVEKAKLAVAHAGRP